MQSLKTKKLKVCIVEDEAMIQEMYKDKLKQEGFLVVTANDGEEGFELIKQEHPDIILADIMMPNQDGIALMGNLKKDPSLSKIPVIILTNLDDSETADRTADFNVAFYLVKAQYSPSDVANVVKEVLDSQHKMIV
jgi:two-component system, OmpR family, alkaline phosphatase synthesis response regulator PhoP